MSKIDSRREGAGGTGTDTTAANLGTGEGVFAQKVASELDFKSLKAGANVTISSSATEITITASGSGGGGTGNGYFPSGW